MSGQTPVIEGIGILNLIKEIKKKMSHLQCGKIIIYSNMKKIVNESQLEIVKESQCTREASATAKATKEEIGKATITIKLEYSSDKIRAHRAFQQNPGLHLMIDCDEKSKEERKNLSNKEIESSCQMGDTTPVHDSWQTRQQMH